MTKSILFDADGVTIVGRYKYFSDRLSAEYGIPVEKIMPFFKNEYHLCSIGKADLKEEVSKYFESWNWTEGVDRLLEYWFEGENEVHSEVLTYVDLLRSKGISCYLATDQEKYRAEYIKNQMELGKHFDDCFFSCDLGYKKSEREFFEKILEKIGPVNPQDVMYWDDDEENVAIASELGIIGKFFTDFGSFSTEMNRVYTL